MFEISGKIALITGGASGIGFECAKELLKNGLKGVLLVDVSQNNGDTATAKLSKDFGSEKVGFKQADTTNKQSLEDAFKKAIEIFHNLDIVINCAGIANDQIWEKEVDVNVKGVVNGSLLALDRYLPQYKSGGEGVLVNIASILGLDPSTFMPVYSGTKHFVVGFSRSLGRDEHYKRTKVRVLVICPGVTNTPLITENTGAVLGPGYESFFTNEVKEFASQGPECVSNCLIEAIRKGKNGSVWMVEGGESPAEIKFLSRFERKIQ